MGIPILVSDLTQPALSHLLSPVMSFHGNTEHCPISLGLPRPVSLTRTCKDQMCVLVEVRSRYRLSPSPPCFLRQGLSLNWELILWALCLTVLGLQTCPAVLSFLQGGPNSSVPVVHRVLN